MEATRLDGCRSMGVLIVQNSCSIRAYFNGDKYVEMQNEPCYRIHILAYTLRKTIEGYLYSVVSLIINTIKTKLFMHAFHSSRYLQSK